MEYTYRTQQTQYVRMPTLAQCRFAVGPIIDRVLQDQWSQERWGSYNSFNIRKKNSDMNCSGITLLGSRTSQIDFVEISGSQTGARNAF